MDVLSYRKPTLFVLLLCAWYGLGAAYVESFVNYPSWSHIHSNGFTIYHQFLAKRITLLLVIPLFFKVALTLVVWYHYKSYRNKLQWVLILQAVFWISSLLIQIPIQGRLDSIGQNQSDIQLLIKTDLWLRTLPHTIEVILFSFLVYKWLTSTTED